MKNVWIWLVVLVVIIGGGYWYWQSSQSASTMTDTTSQTQDTTDTSTSGTADTSPAPTGTSVDVSATVGAAKTVTVTYNGDAFTPKTVTVNKGDTVKFVDTSGTMWVASDPHPTHQGYDGTTRSQHCVAGYAGAAPFDQCSSGTSFSFTFQKTGSWGYHDHLNDNLGGTVIVQ